MDISQRQFQVLRHLEQSHFLSIKELAQHIFVSEATIRRDVEKLEEKGLVKSVYGGVVMSEYSNEVVPVSLRDRENSAEKERVAQHAAELIHDNDTVLFDSSSTVRRICKHIKSRKNLTIITNNLRVCQELKDSDVTVYSTGGMLARRRDCFLGHYTELFLRNIHADSMFFSAQGITDDGHITDSGVEELAVLKVMMEHADKHYFLCDSSKFGKQYPFTLCHIDDITEVISNRP